MANTITVRRVTTDRLSNKTPVTFSDVAAYFSQEEWKLLHEWQNELYNNVMKEIQQALSSLGPLIASSVFSLRAKEKEDICFVENQDKERRPNVDLAISGAKSSSEETFRIRQEKKEYLLGQPDSEFDTARPIVSFTIKEEDDVEYVDHHDSETAEHISSPKGFNVNGTKSETSVLENVCSQVAKANTYIIEGFNVHGTKSETSVLENVCSQVAKANTYIIEDDGRMNIKQTFGHSDKCSDKSAACRSSTGNARSKVVQSFVESGHSVNQIWSVNDQEQKGEQSTQIQSHSNFKPPTNSILHPKISNLLRSSTFNNCPNIMTNASIPCNTNVLDSWSTYACSDTEPNFYPNESHVELKGTHTEKGQDSHIECVQSPSGTSVHVPQESVDTQHRPYCCSVCGKSFSSRQIFIRHQKIHTGERPYQCNICGNSFRLKEFLNQHLNIHTGERPFHCNVCGKRFSRKGTLVRHQAVHMK